VSDDRPFVTEVAELLQRVDSADAAPPPVEIEETHISWVFLTERHAFKLKKPVAFGFVDFSAVALREAACRDEVRLNRRLAPDVYLGVVPLVRDRQGQLTLGGKGETVDWLVEMRRLASDMRLDELIRRDELSDHQIESLGKVLADFCRHAPAVTMSGEQYLATLERKVRDNHHDLVARVDERGRAWFYRAMQSQLRTLKLSPRLLCDRAHDGRIVEGHGDLRPEHLYLTPTPVAIDCLEFSQTLRKIDVADELAFLAMECDRLGRPDVGEQLSEACRRAIGDRINPAVTRFYKMYRACVRAKVAALRQDQLAPNRRAAPRQEVEEYLRFAAGYVPPEEKPLLLVVGGLMGTGKSTLARALADALLLQTFQTDGVRRELFGQSESPTAFDAERYAPQNRQRVYDELARLADQVLGRGVSVVLDGTYMSAAHRSEVQQLGRKNGVQPLFCFCQCPDEVARGRIESRLRMGRDPSEARPELLEGQRQEADFPRPGPDVLVIDTMLELDEQVDRVLAHLRARCAG